MPIKNDIKILVIDDMSTMRRLIKKMLTEMGFTNISEADDGATAWPMIEIALKENESFEFIISDWNMPLVSGIDLLRSIRATPGLQRLPFLMITAEGDQENVVTAVQAGVSNFILKPFTPEILKEKIESIFK